MAIILAVLAAISISSIVLEAPSHLVTTPAHDLNIPASYLNWEDSCTTAQPTDYSSSCIKSSLFDINYARKAESLPPLRLPKNFLKTSPAAQLEYLVNRERQVRGLAPIKATSKTLTRSASLAAKQATDPSIPKGYVGGSDWAGNFPNTLVVDFEWMYEDGFRHTNAGGGSNVDCHYPGASGCWGHRKVILEQASAPTYFGASFTTDLATRFRDLYLSSFAIVLAGPPNLAGPETVLPTARLLLTLSLAGLAYLGIQSLIAGAWRYYRRWRARGYS